MIAAAVRFVVAHVTAPLGMTYYSSDLLSAQYHGNLAITEHGYHKARRMVAFSTDAPGIPQGEAVELIGGWGPADGRTDRR